MIESQEQLAQKWVAWASGENTPGIPPEWHCETRDVFQARLGRMAGDLIRSGIDEAKAYILSAIAGEIGNNSFDHNLGNWPDVPGVWFSFEVFPGGKAKIVLADRGNGVLQTLRRVKAELTTDAEALRTAFTEKLSGRAPENRGNGLKFARSMVDSGKLRLTFSSGDATIELEEAMEFSASEEVFGCLAILES